ncbi:E3 ubiquitin-protein ligase PUB23-like [Prosopis cineraria]|uniref:E3 ubiquitin-protein ligase PUB23-like n=1 Tax=Prosopis cineraria TaxID=364024 RepID=UPI0024108C85|nr:E3 ubiquitin-protein ligase PUB23-like [Prosopis cineraria]
MDEIDVPSHFLCPISLQLMTDPVTVRTGITYDRENIERWLFSCNNRTCPVTKQSILDMDLTPNHTLRRLIQAWCTLNASSGIERIPTPKPPVDKIRIVELLSEASRSPRSHLKCLGMLRSIAFESDRNKIYLESAGAIEFLASTLKFSSGHARVDDDNERSVMSIEAALEVLFHLNPSESHFKNLVSSEGIQFIQSLIRILGNGNYQSRAYSTILLKSAFGVADPTQLMNVRTELFAELVRVLRDKISQQASKAALKLVVELCPWGKNRIKAVEGGVGLVLIEMLLEATERRACELILVALDQLCGCAEGRAELLKHGAGVAIVSKKILRVSQVATDRGVKILSWICRHSANARVLQEMLQVGAVCKLCLVLQVEASLKTKERAKEVLKLHSNTWRNSACIPAPLLQSYPSSDSLDK